jgi:hypothetical protein
MDAARSAMKLKNFEAAVDAMSTVVDDLDRPEADWCPVFRTDALGVMLADRAECYIQTRQSDRAMSDAKRAIDVCSRNHEGCVGCTLCSPAMS